MGVYSFMNVAAAINGPGGSFPLGYGSNNAEEGISVSMTEDKNTMTVGADGNVMHSLHAGRSGTITVRLLKTAPTNALLNQMYRFQTSSSANHGKNTITVRDPTRGDVVVAQQGAFKKQPDLSYAKVGGMVEWVFDCGMIDEKLGSGL